MCCEKRNCAEKSAKQMKNTGRLFMADSKQYFSQTIFFRIFSHSGNIFLPETSMCIQEKHGMGYYIFRNSYCVNKTAVQVWYNLYSFIDFSYKESIFMQKRMKKVLTLVLAGILAAGSVIGAAAGGVDNDSASAVSVLHPSISQKPQLSKTAKCPECGKACYEFSYIVGSYVLNSYVCAEHGQVEPVYPENKPVINTTYTIRTITTEGGTITLCSDAPIKPGDSRTVYITPDYGYICTAVYVNGYNYGVMNKLELNNISGNYRIYAVFKAVNQNHINIISINSAGNGQVIGVLNNKNYGEVTSIGAKYGDLLTLRFTPAKGNYTVSNVAINGVNMGSITQYCFEKLYYDVKVDVSFQWNNPFEDVTSHLNAVEYVYENGIMESPNKYINTNQFQGTQKVSLRFLSAFLAELADVDNVLETTAERVAWAKELGIISDSDKLSTYITMEQASAVVEKFVRALEESRNLTFTELKNVSGAKDIAKTIGYASDSTYKNNCITRYDVAEICYGIAQLEVE